eukprot:gnl/Ergobibamus_cyprinoides/144.p1 GENE.gnl/Ergobibamus_cyprinoides/144~~gnl/Ergobibamus_cyprinoides/144.p1  ORF type:complete len:539 (+),score=147.00 gnl/Ergobibamus_cyprinoides/144:161-1777(+)
MTTKFSSLLRKNLSLLLTSLAAPSTFPAFCLPWSCWSASTPNASATRPLPPSSRLCPSFHPLTSRTTLSSSSTASCTVSGSTTAFSGAQLCPIAFKHSTSGPAREQIRPGRRRALPRRASHGPAAPSLRFLPKMVAVTTRPVAVDLLSVLETLQVDPQDSVRAVNVRAAVSFVTTTRDARRVHQSFTRAADDDSWRVRYAAAELCVPYLAAVREVISSGDEHATAAQAVLELMPAQFIALLDDGEPEVRGAAATALADFARLIPVPRVFDTLVPTVSAHARDAAEFVRTALATSVMKICPVGGAEGVDTHLRPVILALLGDECADVRLNIISNLGEVAHVAGAASFSDALLPAVFQLAEDNNWRVRRAVIRAVPDVAAQLGQEAFDERLASLCLAWLGDAVFAIREAAVENVQKLASIFGPAWTSRAVMPKISAMRSHPNYLHRMTGLLCCGALAEVLPAASVANDLVPIARRMAGDPVPNVRFAAARTLGKLAGIVDNGVVAGVIKPALMSLAEDADRDVSFFAAEALQASLPTAAA